MSKALVAYYHCQVRVIENGDHVICSVTGDKIPLNDLYYWDVNKQVAYKNAGVVPGNNVKWDT